MFTEKEGAIALLEDRLAQAKKALEGCADEKTLPVVRLAAARDALAVIWPTPPKPRVIEVGREYTAANGGDYECISIHDGVAYLVFRNMEAGIAYVWDIYGKSLSINPAYDIDWSRS